jgi:hypothetical protein
LSVPSNRFNSACNKPAPRNGKRNGKQQRNYHPNQHRQHHQHHSSSPRQEPIHSHHAHRHHFNHLHADVASHAIHDYMAPGSIPTSRTTRRSHPSSEGNLRARWRGGRRPVLRDSPSQAKTPVANKPVRACELTGPDNGMDSPKSSRLPSTNRHGSIGLAQRAHRINGADIYVARLGRGGDLGTAHPCTRCLQWCRWAGIRRIFHWSPSTGSFEAVKVAEAEKMNLYMTEADRRLAAGLVTTFCHSRNYTLLNVPSGVVA